MKHADREHQRVYLTFYLRIFDDEKFIGFLIDISKEGMMVMSEFPLETEKVYSIRMKIPSSFEWKGKNEPDRFINFSAKCEWTKHDDVEKEFYLSGFTFINLDDSENELIHAIIKEYKIK
jgi:c-di-GMP-binding flagellar brake protein YcgR